MVLPGAAGTEVGVGQIKQVLRTECAGIGRQQIGNERLAVALGQINESGQTGVERRGIAATNHAIQIQAKSASSKLNRAKLIAALLL